jgi:hypothetical protein
LFSVHAEHRPAVAALARESDCPITRIGHIVSQAEGVCVHAPDGTLYTPAQTGYDHFRQK